MWPQLYDPFGNRGLSTLVSALPVVTLFLVLVAFFVLVALKKRVWVAALSGFLGAVTFALFVFDMPARLVAGLSSDKRLQLVLVAFCFGAFLDRTHSITTLNRRCLTHRRFT